MSSTASEGKQTELAKAQDRFPIRVDLLPSDIDEVTESSGCSTRRPPAPRRSASSSRPIATS